jgi:hypothetical protein
LQPDHDKEEAYAIFKEFGIISFSDRVVREGNVFVNYNWLHFLSQIIVLL